MTRLLPSLTIYRKSSATPCSPSGIQWIPNVLRPPYTDSSSISNVYHHSSVIQATTSGTKIARRLSLSSIPDRPIPVLAIDRSPAQSLDHPRVNDCYARHDATATTGGDDDDDDDVNDREVGGGLARGNARVTVDDESSRSDEEILGGRQAGWRGRMRGRERRSGRSRGEEGTTASASVLRRGRGPVPLLPLLVPARPVREGAMTLKILFGKHLEIWSSNFYTESM
ncbi:hypothetical protein ALC57_12276 [Trachymyrmex cornetzi]|uniref:Uncharacterized protein n=1 Tax=Trachymyrmex cornetzi TaxID=471704 RepID=A0A151J0Z2_9HYME|nr:hypothetical protein ALC57_12276 [Trachymyrmex cornetzi]